MARRDGRELTPKECHEQMRDASVPCPCCGGLIVICTRGWTPAIAEFYRLYRELRDARMLYYATVEDVAEYAVSNDMDLTLWKEPRE